MAVVKRFEPSAPVGAVRRHPTSVTCGYHVVTTRGGSLLQLDTYGSEDRQLPGKVSQSIQIDADAARALIGVLRTAFPGI